MLTILRKWIKLLLVWLRGLFQQTKEETIMTAPLSVEVPFPVFQDRDGQPLDNGYVWIGVANLNPQTNPVNVYLDNALTILAAQPLRTINGYISTTGSPTQVFIDGANYSILVQDSKGSMVYNFADSTGAGSADACDIIYEPPFIGGVAYPVCEKLEQIISVKDFGAVGNGVTNDLPAFQAAHDSLSPLGSSVGGEIWIPPGNYYLAGTWVITKRVKISGASRGDQVGSAASRLTFPINVTGIRVHSLLSSGTGSGADNTVIQDLNLAAVSAAGTVGHGIHMSTRCMLYRLIIRNFGENGLHTVANAGTGTGNANNFYYENVRVVDVNGHGFFTSEADANAGGFMLCDATSNNGWGFFEDSKLGNTYYSCHADGNVLGSFKNEADGGSVNASVFIGNYIESGATARTSFVPDKSIWLGGTGTPGTMPTVRATAGALELNTTDTKPHIFLRNGSEIGRIDSTSKLTGFSGYTAGSGTLFTNIVPSLISLITNSTSSSDRMRFDNPNGRVGSISTSGSATAYNTSSDYRLKTNIEDMGSAIGVIQQLRPVTYDWKIDGKFGSGFIAHELQAILPQCVSGEKDAEEVENTYDENGNVISSKLVPSYQGMDVSFIVPYLVKAIQELQAKVDSLSAHT